MQIMYNKEIYFRQFVLTFNLNGLLLTNTEFSINIQSAQ